MNGKTGIEIQVGLTGGQKVIGKVLHALHLEKIGKMVAAMQSAYITIDDMKRQEPLYEAHFVEADPGPHAIAMSLAGPVPTPDALMSVTFGAKLDVTVEAGKVAVLLFTPHDGGGATLSLVETRDA